MTESDAVSRRLESLESKLTFQEDLLSDLNDALIAQQTRVDKLEASLRTAIATLQQIAPAASAADDDQPPPHY